MKPGLCPFCRTLLRPNQFDIWTTCGGCGYQLPTSACYVADDSKEEMKA